MTRAGRPSVTSTPWAGRNAHVIYNLRATSEVATFWIPSRARQLFIDGGLVYSGVYRSCFSFYSVNAISGGKNLQKFARPGGGVSVVGRPARRIFPEIREKLRKIEPKTINTPNREIDYGRNSKSNDDGARLERPKTRHVYTDPRPYRHRKFYRASFRPLVFGRAITYFDITCRNFFQIPPINIKYVTESGVLSCTRLGKIQRSKSAKLYFSSLVYDSKIIEIST